MQESKKVVKVPVILQMEALECGAACLAMIMAYYHKWVPLEQVRLECGVSRDGSNAMNVGKAAVKYGMNFKGFWYKAETLPLKATFPCIIFWNRNHFVVLDGFKKGYAYINDPASGRIRLSMEDFTASYSGACLLFEPGENFVADGKRKSITDYLRDSLQENRRLMLLVVITGALAAISGVFSPIISRIYTDTILPGNADDWVNGFLGFFTGVIIFIFITSAIHQIYVRKSIAKIAVTSNARFMEHVLHLPMEFFSQRTAGDLAGRQTSNDMVASTLIGQLAPTLINFVMLVFYLFVMIRYSIPLTIVGLGTIAVNLLLTREITERRTDLTRMRMRDQARLNATTVAGIDMVETIKASGSERGFMERWSGFHASVIKGRVRFSRTSRVLGTVPDMIQQISSLVILTLGIYSIMKGYFTVGVFLAFQSCMSSFMSPVNQLIGAAQTIQEMRSSLERIDDVMIYPEDMIADESYDLDELEKSAKLSGNIEINHVTFGYSRLGDPIIDDFNLSIKQGQRIAIVGGSGSGKSTIAKLLTGLYKPWKGEILYDGKRIQDIPRPIFSGSVAMVDQEVVLFKDTVENNIKMWDNSIEDFEMILAARDASLHEDIVAQKDGYHRVLEENGRDLSGGQRQRMEIARVLAVDPSIVVMDEATSALDARTEFDVSNEIHARGITCIIVAHRLSTIRDCDQIIVLDNGKIVQQGTHRELITQDGLYRKLVTTQ